MLERALHTDGGIWLLIASYNNNNDDLYGGGAKSRYVVVSSSVDTLILSLSVFVATDMLFVSYQRIRRRKSCYHKSHWVLLAQIFRVFIVPFESVNPIHTYEQLDRILFSVSWKFSPLFTVSRHCHRRRN